MVKKFMEISRVTTASALAAALIFGGTSLPHSSNIVEAQTVTTSSAVSAQAVDDYHIVAVGDSLTVGYINGMEKEANPVPYGYVERVYEQALFHGLRASVSHYGILGLTTEGLQHYIEAAEKGEAVKAVDLPFGTSKDPRIDQLAAATPQLFADLEAADLVTITTGSNDFLTVFDKLKDGTGAAAVAEMLPIFEQQLEASLRAVIGINPKAEIVVSDLYNPAPHNKLLISEEAYQALAQASQDVRSRIENVAKKLTDEGFNVRVAHVGDPFLGHELEYTTVAKGDFHPNAKGYTSMGKSFSQAIWGDYREVAPRAADVPISVVVAGKELQTANKPVLKNNKTYVPMRDITDAMGALLKWDGKTQTATVTFGDRVVAITIGAKTMVINGTTVALDTPAYLQKVGKETKTYLPLAALSDGLGFQVIYRGTLKTAFINK
ncbi:copper amine oxidase [Paenibacillus sp. PR3]|uniref:Copper amine oxidase n=1 Tax=Paenibacillus terricola TaxID=2763503 RepID=A0ABR8MZZ5_9BACL|nr:stalk domain-containing protein [Paenibacillus terricola]MBD3921530.1 copper amine oxidase [Paenibacillus terricola]